MRLRVPGPADFDAVVALIRARDVADLGAPDFTADDLRADWREPGWHPESGARVAEDDEGRIVGYAWVSGERALGATLPGAEGRGVGAALLDWIERRPGRLRQPVGEGNVEAAALLRAHGWTRAWTDLRLAIALDGELPAAAPPAPTRLRPVALPGDGPALHAISERAFATLADFVPESFERFAHQHLEAADRELSRLAERDGAPVGFALVRRWTEEDAGYVDLLAVEPGAAGGGIGTALLAAVFAACRDAGLAECQLGVGGHNPRAAGVYARAGLTARYRVDRYERAAG